MAIPEIQMKCYFFDDADIFNNFENLFYKLQILFYLKPFGAKILKFTRQTKEPVAELWLEQHLKDYHA